MPIFQTEVSFRNPGFFRGTDALSVGFKMKPLGQGDVPVKTKTNSNLAIKFVEMRKGLLNHLAQTPVFLVEL